MATRQAAPAVTISQEQLLAEFVLSHNNLPEYIWTNSMGIHHLEFMMHDRGCWAIISSRADGEETDRINLGTCKSLEEIRTLIAGLEQAR